MLLGKKARKILALVAIVLMIISVLYIKYIKLDMSFIFFTVLLSVYLVYFVIKDLLLNYRYKIVDGNGGIYLVKEYQENDGVIEFKNLIFNNSVKLNVYTITDLDGE